MGKVIMSGIVPPLVAPVTGIQLGTIAEGSIVKLNEGGSPVEFYVAKHDYESGLNGAGRTVLVRKNVYPSLVMWHSVKNFSAYASSYIDSWLNGSYKALLDSVVQTAIASTNFYYTPSFSNKTVTSLSRAVFTLSATEFGVPKAAVFNTEGSALPIASSLQPVVFNGALAEQWTRSPNIQSSGYIIRIGVNGFQVSSLKPNTSSTIRPCFTLPATTVFDEETMMFTGKIA